jgi:hypothetical protein
MKQWERENGRSHPLIPRLSLKGQEGFIYAEELAGAARARRYAAIEQEDPEYDDATIGEVGSGYDQRVSATTVRNRIAQARVELFGHRSDRAIRRLLARVEQAAARSCKIGSCGNPLPIGATSRRLYCDRHSQPWAKAERYRLKRRSGKGREHGSGLPPPPPRTV